MPSIAKSLIGLLAFSPVVLANINFTWVNPSCSAQDPDNCLRGQHCQGTSCVPDYTTNLKPNRQAEKRRTMFETMDLEKRQTITTDGTCGTQNGGTICGNWPSGSCCSPYGWW